ncbi:DUF5074 domain-containing protein [Chryseolinea lacunae]|uniref:YncE family protein n=1 Tax=Chryseolinea lacunae TaxID=2801331 RepID=A0ABS1KUH5_9BACT|nr:DUF5074 domain-containing protein [Chryseolinea lacunae]MBL0742357.1 hypothetical protein [Chryseolinea lacunae]
MNNRYPAAPAVTHTFKAFATLRRMAILVLLVVSLWACKDDEQAPKGKFEHGALVINEGAFGGGNGSITYYNTTTGMAEQNIYRNVIGKFAGDVTQSLTIHDDKAYIVLNGDNKIEIADANTFERLGTISDDAIVQPRYLEVVGNYAYLTVQGEYDANYNLVESSVLVIDLSTNKVIKKLETDKGVENIVHAGNYLFASNYYYGQSSTVTVIDPATNAFVKYVDVASGPSGMAVDVNGKLWVISQGDESSVLTRINPSTFEKETTIDLGLSADTDLAITPDKSSLIYYTSGRVYKIAITATTAPSTPFFTIADLGYEYALGVDPENGDIWVGDAPTFTADGKVFIYGADGKSKTTFTSGIGPTNFVFK